MNRETAAPAHQKRPPYWAHFEHRADIGVRGVGRSLSEAFEQAAYALSAVICDLDAIRATTTLEVQCHEDDPELLLVDWLNEIVYAMATKNMLFSHYEVTIEQGELTARIAGEPVDIARHQPAVEIKGATYTALAVVQEKGLWRAQCVLDV